MENVIVKNDIGWTWDVTGLPSLDSADRFPRLIFSEEVLRQEVEDFSAWRILGERRQLQERLGVLPPAAADALFAPGANSLGSWSLNKDHGMLELELQMGAQRHAAWIQPRRVGCDRGHWDCGHSGHSIGSYYFMRLENAIREVEVDLLLQALPPAQAASEWSDRVRPELARSRPDHPSLKILDQVYASPKPRPRIRA